MKMNIFRWLKKKDSKETTEIKSALQEAYIRNRLEQRIILETKIKLLKIRRDDLMCGAYTDTKQEALKAFDVLKINKAISKADAEIREINIIVYNFEHGD